MRVSHFLHLLRIRTHRLCFKRLELWVDGKKLTQAFNDQINARVSVAAGTHRVTIVAVDLYDAIVKNAMTVTVP